MNNRQNQIFYPILIAVLGFAVWAYSMGVPFQFDDERVILSNIDLRHPDTFLDPNVSFSFHGRPLSYFTFMINYQVNQLNVIGYHIINILIHIFSSIALYQILLLLLNKFYSKKVKSIFFAAFLGSLFFLIHPLQVESVAYISQRMTSLSGMFLLWTFFYYLKFRLAEKVKYSHLIPIVLFFVLSFFSKQIALNILPIILVTEILVVEKNTGIPQKWIFYIVSFISILIVLFVWWNGVETRDSLLLSRKTYFISEIPVLVSYLAKTIFPISLNIDYDVPVYNSLFETIPFYSFVLLIMLLSGAWLYKKQKPLIAYGVFLFFAALSLESSFFPIKDLMADHRVYISIAGISIVLSTLWLETSLVKVKNISAAVLLIALTCVTLVRISDWQSVEKIWQDSVEKSPEKSRPWNNLGMHWLQEEKYSKADSCFTKAVELNPLDYSAFNNLGVVSYHQKKYFKALKAFYSCYKINNTYYPALINFGKILIDLKLYYHALFLYNSVEKMYPQKPEIMFNKAKCFEKMNEFDKALKMYNNAMELDPYYSDACYNAGVLCMDLMQDNQAILFFEKLIQFSPEDKEAYNNLAVLYYRNGNVEKSKELLEIALKIDPNFSEAVKNYKKIGL